MKSPSKKHFWLRWVAWGLLALLVWVGIIIGRMLYIGSHDEARKADVIIVFGAAVRKGEPSPAFAARIRHGVELWKGGFAPTILFTGGLGHGGETPEAEIARRVAIGNGVPEAAIRVETRSHITWENLAEAHAVMNREGLRTAIIVSDPDHLMRAHMMASDLGMAHFTSPTPYSVFRSWRTRVPFLLNELWHCHKHRCGRWLGQRPLPERR
jgi:uncharacterized SAM-binding protein YcdF (DUF218 family)